MFRFKLQVFFYLISLVLVLPCSCHHLEGHNNSLNFRSDDAYGTKLELRDIKKFSFLPNTYHGNCGTDQGRIIRKLTSWSEDVPVLTKAAIDQLDKLIKNTDLDIVHVEDTLAAYLGITRARGNYIKNVEMVKSTLSISSHFKLVTVQRPRPDDYKAWFEDAQKFNDGMFGDFGYNKAWILCNDDYQEEQSNDDFVRDTNGDLIKDAAGQPNLRIWEAYPTEINAGYTAFWIPGLKSYTFQPRNEFQPGERCSRALAFTGSSHGNSETFITFCDRQIPNMGVTQLDFHAADTIGQVIVQDTDNLDDVTPGSGTLLHEIMHATRGSTSTNDNAKNSIECRDAAVNDPVNSAQASPQCSVLFAVAMYHRANHNRVFWWKGESTDSDTALQRWIVAMPLSF